MTTKIQIIDSHTGGEPTRVIIAGGPDLGDGPLRQRRTRFSAEFDHFRRATVCEPRGSDVLVGAILVPPHDPTCDEGVIFFNNVGMLGMCVHGTIGVAVTLAHLGKAQPGSTLKLDTPVGVVSAELSDSNHVAVTNVPSYRFRADVEIQVPSLGMVHGDIAWAGNWFFLCEDHGIEVSEANIASLQAAALAIKAALVAADITGVEGTEIDHIELFGPPSSAASDSRNFVLCPGNAYDRSPCGTGTSAKLACLAAKKTLAPGQPWRQESIVGSVFTGNYQPTSDHSILPTISGSAYIMAEATLLIDTADPFGWGFSEPVE